MTKTVVCMDNCGFQSTIEGTLLDDGKIGLKIATDCPSINKMLEDISEIDPMQLIGSPLTQSIVHQAASKCLRHLARIIPSAIIRTVEVEAGIALPGKSSITTEKS